MPFEKGKQKTGGRKKGAVNKRTALLDAFAQTVCEEGAEKFTKELNKLKGKQYVDAYLMLFEYVKPKLSRTEATLKGQVNLNQDITFK